MRVRENDVVYVGSGSVHWTVIQAGDIACVLQSQMTGRARLEQTANLRHWNPEID